MLPPLRQFDGPLTSDLVLTPAAYGLGQVPARLTPDGVVTSVCGFCSTGCGLDVHLRGGEAINLSPASRYPVNMGMACPKGWEALAPLAANDRATTPLLRDSEGRLTTVDWDTAMKTFASRLREVQNRWGAESAAFLGTGQIVTEELAFLGCLAKFGLGMIHGDGNTRQCMATAVAAYKESFGFDAPPYTYKDFEESDVIVLIGSNLCIAHPIMWQRICRNRRNPEIIVVDPRRTETAMAATHHYAIRPKSDLALFHGLAHIVMNEHGVNRDYVHAYTDEASFEEFSRFLREWPPARTAAETGLAEGEIRRFAESLRPGRRVSFWWTMGVNQSHQATRTAQAIINLALMTGNLGQPGTGANSITGQCNAMGSRLFSNTTNLLGGHDFTQVGHRHKISRVLGIPIERIPDRPSKAYDQILEGIGSGAIKALWIVATNTAHSWIGNRRISDLLGKLEFLVVQDMYATTETARLAHLFLPAAGWGEKEGTFINSERRIGRARKVARAPGLALADFSIFRLAAHYTGCGEMFKKWTAPEAVFQLLKEASRGQPCEITGIKDYAHLDREGGIQWPWKEGEAESPAVERRLFADGKFFHPDGRARFVFAAPESMPEPPCSRYPLLLLTGRGSSAQWHTLSRTNKSPILRKLAPDRTYLDIHPDDAAALGIAPHDPIEVESQRGKIVVRARVTPTIRAGEVFLPMHDPMANVLTLPLVDPISRQPAYKACAVCVRRLEPRPFKRLLADPRGD
jgi:assimilatory nitrate reductase catalytic subunit